MKGIILAGGSGSRLFPMTRVMSKQLLPVYDKPMIYYPLSILMLAGVREILIITTPQDRDRFYQLLGDGEHLGLAIQYVVQEKPDGIPCAFTLGKDFIGNDRVCLILGDNIFYGDALVNKHILPNIARDEAVIFCYNIKNPTQYGVVELNKDGDILSVEEKPKYPKSDYAVTGIYVFNADVVDVARTLMPSARGEKEIVAVIEHYIAKRSIKAELLGRGIAWLDAGTPASLQEASSFIGVIENRQGMKIACLEEIAYRQGYISVEKLSKLIKPMASTPYGRYLKGIIGARYQSK